MRTEVHKFGGTSVGDAERIRAAASLLADALGSGARVCAVSSAMAGVTDSILRTAQRAANGVDIAQSMYDLRDRHLETLARLSAADREHVEAEIERLIDDAWKVLQGTALLRQLTLRTRDHVVAIGEKLAVRLLAAALRGAGHQSTPLDADTFLETDARFGEADPLSYVADRRAASVLEPLLASGVVPVVTGFCGRAHDGATTTFGRGGSDFTATLLGAALRADEITIWTDVDGVFSADPRTVPGARPIEQLHYREAAEMSYYGARVLHARTMIPIEPHAIPVRVRNSLCPSSRGTVVDSRFTPGDHPVKAVSAVRDQALVSIEGKGMAGVPGIAARAFACLAEHDISVTMISQSSSEASVCFAVPGNHVFDVESVVKREFRSDISQGRVEDVIVRPGVGLVAAVGLGMAHTTGVSGRVFESLARVNVNVLAIAQGSSELNISLAVDESEIDRSINAIHAAFGLGGEDVTGSIALVIRGYGQIGRRLAELVGDLNDDSKRAHLPEIRLVGVSDRSAVVVDRDGLSHRRLTDLASVKHEGGKLADVEDAIPLESDSDLIAACSSLWNPVLADCTDDPDAGEVFLAAFDAGMDVVTANKNPMSGEDDSDDTLQDRGPRRGRLIRAEATVGAGLPIVDTLEMFINTGDVVESISGCLSGSLGYVMTRIEDGASLIEAVESAVELGFTEPDPALDLSGRDVLRKAVILGRLSGLLRSVNDIRCEPLLGEDAIGVDVEARRAFLDAAGKNIQSRMSDARARGRTLRFIAEITRDSAWVGLREVERDSAFGRLRGTESLVSITSARYREQPLVISGTGAGADVTAAGMLTDLIRVARIRTIA